MIALMSASANMEMPSDEFRSREKKASFARWQKMRTKASALFCRSFDKLSLLLTTSIITGDITNSSLLFYHPRLTEKSTANLIFLFRRSCFCGGQKMSRGYHISGAATEDLFS